MSGHRPVDLYREWKPEPSLGGRHHGNLGVQAQREDEHEARAGSTMLAKECKRAIFNFAAKYRIPVNDARVLLLDCGLKDQREAV